MIRYHRRNLYYPETIDRYFSRKYWIFEEIDGCIENTYIARRLNSNKMRS